MVIQYPNFQGGCEDESKVLHNVAHSRGMRSCKYEYNYNSILGGAMARKTCWREISHNVYGKHGDLI